MQLQIMQTKKCKVDTSRTYSSRACTIKDRICVAFISVGGLLKLFTIRIISNSVNICDFDIRCKKSSTKKHNQAPQSIFSDVS